MDYEKKYYEALEMAKSIHNSSNASRIRKEWIEQIFPELRPQSNWKPSEEQIETLEYVIIDYREDGCNATANYLQEILDHLMNM